MYDLKIFSSEVNKDCFIDFKAIPISKIRNNGHLGNS